MRREDGAMTNLGDGAKDLDSQEGEQRLLEEHGGGDRKRRQAKTTGRQTEGANQANSLDEEV
jgi:hypothetical protein